MSIKLVILAVLVLIIVSLFWALYYFYTDKGESNKMVKTLTVRISLSLLLIITVALSFKFGLLKPSQIAQNMEAARNK